MKKSLIALAVLGFAGAAMAQSSVTLYGVADAGLGGVKGNTNPASGAAYGKTGGKTEFIGAGLMNNGDSRVGLRGTEDLGGGLNVGFNFETGLNLDTGATQGAMWQRQANVHIGGAWGTVKLGRQFTPSYLANSTYELTGMANYTVVGNTYGWLGVADRRAPSAFAYISPNFSGLTAAVAYVTKHDVRTALGAPGAKAAWDAALLYSGGPISAGLGINKISTNKTNYQLGGKYNFGQFAIAASYTQSSIGDARRRGFGIGGSATFGAFSATLDLTRDTKNQWRNNQWNLFTRNKKYTNGIVEVKYAMSKRTFVYGVFGRFDSTNNWGIGLHHSF